MGGKRASVPADENGGFTKHVRAWVPQQKRGICRFLLPHFLRNTSLWVGPGERETLVTQQPFVTPDLLSLDVTWWDFLEFKQKVGRAGRGQGGGSILEKGLKNKKYIFLLFSNAREGFNMVDSLLLHCTKHLWKRKLYFFKCIKSEPKAFRKNNALGKKGKPYFSGFLDAIVLKRHVPI